MRFFDSNIMLSVLFNRYLYAFYGFYLCREDIACFSRDQINFMKELCKLMFNHENFYIISSWEILSCQKLNLKTNLFDTLTFLV